ncbi:MAG: hypothetical protein SP4CHLAM5_07870 [Chlamydiia bacterium]|nr:hypothetical protein [Chlamydiia bacterium]MCH9618651.1 hypothetical protein [Chlamydiia bacterium]MCH9623842.1 hypothetical protein [Chlamydiia bacterium]
MTVWPPTLTVTAASSMGAPPALFVMVPVMVAGLDSNEIFAVSDASVMVAPTELLWKSVKLAVII